LTFDGLDTNDERGFVYDTVTHTDPGNVAPASSDYTSYVTEAGTFGEGTFTLTIDSLTQGTTYYYRAFSHNSFGYDYGEEVIFETTETTSWTNETKHSSIWTDESKSSTSWTDESKSTTKWTNETL